MKRITITSLYLVAVFAVSAIATATAFAKEPEYRTGESEWCATCVVGEGERSEGRTVSKEDWTATKPTELGFETGKPITHVFAGVELGPGETCSSAEAAPGEVKTALVDYKLAFINKAKGEVGLLEAPAASEGLLSKFTCGHNVIETRGALLGQITPTNTKVKALSVNIAISEDEKQAITKFEGGTAVLEAQFDGRGFHEIAISDPGEIIASPGTTLEVSTAGTSPELIERPEAAGKGPKYAKGGVDIKTPLPTSRLADSSSRANTGERSNAQTHSAAPLKRRAPSGEFARDQHRRRLARLPVQGKSM